MRLFLRYQVLLTMPNLICDMTIDTIILVVKLVDGVFYFGLFT